MAILECDVVSATPAAQHSLPPIMDVRIAEKEAVSIVGIRAFASNAAYSRRISASLNRVFDLNVVDYRVDPRGTQDTSAN
jgi:hypothetical protein